MKLDEEPCAGIGISGAAVNDMQFLNMELHEFCSACAETPGQTGAAVKFWHPSNMYW